jgi:hypothetical protein
MVAAATAASKQTAKSQLEAQIAARQKLVKLLKKKAAVNDATLKAKLQLRIKQLQALAGLQPTATTLPPTTAAAVLPAMQPCKALSSAAGRPGSTSLQQHKQQQPLSGITQVLANTPVEQVRQCIRRQNSRSKCACLLVYMFQK